jgi:hypothetical protein
MFFLNGSIYTEFALITVALLKPDVLLSQSNSWGFATPPENWPDSPQ